MGGNPRKPHADAQRETAPEDFEREHEMRRPPRSLQTAQDRACVVLLRLPFALQASNEIVTHGDVAP
jgi:hypothetical protein